MRKGPKNGVRKTIKRVEDKKKDQVYKQNVILCRAIASARKQIVDVNSPDEKFIKYQLSMVKKRAESQRKWFERYHYVPGETQYSNFHNQMGVKDGFNQFFSNKDLRTSHVNQIRFVRSPITSSKQMHEIRYEKNKLLLHANGAKEKSKRKQISALKLQNQKLTKRLATVQSKITQSERAPRKNFKSTTSLQTHFLRLARKHKLDKINQENHHLLRFLGRASSYYDKREHALHFKRHKKLRKQLRKVDPPRSKSPKRRLESRDIAVESAPSFFRPRAKDNLLQNMVHDRLRQGLQSAAASTHNFLGPKFPNIMRDRSALKTAGSSRTTRKNQRGSMLMSNPHEGIHVTVGSLGKRENKKVVITESGDKSPEKEVLLYHTNSFKLRGVVQSMSVFRLPTDEGLVRFEFRTLQEEYVPSRSRVVHVSIDKIKSICHSYAALLFSNNINRFERIALLLDLEGEFDDQLLLTEKERENEELQRQILFHILVSTPNIKSTL